MKKEETKEKNKNNVTKNNSQKKQHSTKESTTRKNTSDVKKTKKVNEPKKEKITSKKEEVIKEEIIKEEVKETKKSKNIKDIVLLIGLVIVIIVGSLMMNGEKPKPAYKLPLELTGEAGLHQLTYQEYEDKINSNVPFVLVIERATCSHCVTYMPVVEKFTKDNNVPIYYVDTDTFSGEDWEKFERSNKYLRENQDAWGTPTTMILVGEEDVIAISGTASEEQLKDLFDNHFDMKKEVEETEE